MNLITYFKNSFLTPYPFKSIFCCSAFNPEPWQQNEQTWDNKLFIKHRVRTFFNIPLNFRKVMMHLNSMAYKAGSQLPNGLCLSEHISSWSMNLYLAVNKEVPGASNTSFTGTIYSKVYEGNIKQTKRWVKDFNNDAVEHDLKFKKMYMWYTTCPVCSKKYGKNYVVILGRV